MNTESLRLGLLTKILLAMRVWRWFLAMRMRLRRETLPVLVERLGRVTATSHTRLPPRRLGLIVHRSLALGSHRPRCLPSSLVLYRLLREQGDAAQIVIGLPHRPLDKDAHAWVEFDGVDVGPPPGRAGHLEIARYG